MELEIIRGLVVLLLSGLGWYMKRTIDSLEAKQDELKKEIASIKEDYIRKEDFKEFKGEIKEMFNEIKADLKELKR